MRKQGDRVSPDLKWRLAQEQKYVRLVKVAGNVAVTFEVPGGSPQIPQEVFKQVLADLIQRAK